MTSLAVRTSLASESLPPLEFGDLISSDRSKQSQAYTDFLGVLCLGEMAAASSCRKILSLLRNDEVRTWVTDPDLCRGKYIEICGEEQSHYRLLKPFLSTGDHFKAIAKPYTSMFRGDLLSGVQGPVLQLFEMAVLIHVVFESAAFVYMRNLLWSTPLKDAISRSAQAALTDILRDEADHVRTGINLVSQLHARLAERHFDLSPVWDSARKHVQIVSQLPMLALGTNSYSESLSNEYLLTTDKHFKRGLHI